MNTLFICHNISHTRAVVKAFKRQGLDCTKPLLAASRSSMTYHRYPYIIGKCFYKSMASILLYKTCSNYIELDEFKVIDLNKIGDKQ